MWSPTWARTEARGSRGRLHGSRTRCSRPGPRPRHDLKAYGQPRTATPAAAGDSRRLWCHRGSHPQRAPALLGLLPSPAPDDAGPRSGLCLDTAHMFAAGYAVHQTAGLASVVAELEAARPVYGAWGLIHLNDSALALRLQARPSRQPRAGGVGLRRPRPPGHASGASPTCPSCSRSPAPRATARARPRSALGQDNAAGGSRPAASAW